MMLDTGALIAADRNDARFWRWWAWMVRARRIPVVTAPVVAQAWRGKRNARLAQALAGCRIVALDADVARAIGELCGRAGVDDVVDGFVVEAAARRGLGILTSDPDDIRRLAAERPGCGRVFALDDLP